MNREYCLFKASKACDNCGECDRCDLNPNKSCNNCGKCLELEGFDMKAVKVDDIIEDVNEVKEYEGELEATNKISVNGDDTHSQSQINSYLDSDIEVNNENTNNNEHTMDSEYKDTSDMDYMDENVEFIDDIDGLRELLEDKDKLDEIAFEVFPGVISFKK